MAGRLERLRRAAPALAEPPHAAGATLPAGAPATPDDDHRSQAGVGAIAGSSKRRRWLLAAGVVAFWAIVLPGRSSRATGGRRGDKRAAG
jgi:hypothetical protein